MFFSLCFHVFCTDLESIIDLTLSNSLDYQKAHTMLELSELKNELYRIGFDASPSLSSTYNRGSSYDQYYNTLTSGYTSYITESESHAHKLSLDKTHYNGTSVSLSVSETIDLSSYSNSKYTDEYGLSLNHMLLGKTRSLDYLYNIDIEKRKLLDAENAALKGMLGILCDSYVKKCRITIEKSSFKQLSELEQEYRDKFDKRLIKKSEYMSVKLSMQEAGLKLKKAEQEFSISLMKLDDYVGKKMDISDSLEVLVRNVLDASEGISCESPDKLSSLLYQGSLEKMVNQDGLKKAELALVNADDELNGNLALNAYYYKRGEGDTRDDANDFKGKRWLVGFSYNLPLDRKEIHSRIREKRLELSDLAQGLERIRKSTRQKAFSWYDSLKSKEMTVSIAAASLEKYRIELSDMKLRFAEKLIPTYEYIETLNQYYGASSYLLGAQVDLTLFRFEIIAASGFPVRDIFQEKGVPEIFNSHEG